MSQRTFPADLKCLGDMLEFIMNEARALSFEGPKLFKIELAAEEVLVNVISYSYPDGEGQIEIILSALPDKTYQICIKDQGIPFNPLTKESEHTVDETVEEMREGGWGVGLVKKSMDHIEYAHDGMSNILTMGIKS